MPPRPALVRLPLLALALAVLGPAPPARAEGKKLALLVGVNKYPEGSGFSSLPFTERDVEQLAGVLLDAGYRPEHVRVLTLKRGNDNPRFLPTLRNTRREFGLLARDRRPEDTLLIALSGHGITRKVGGKPVGFFCPIDADIGDTDSLLSLEGLYAEMEQSRAGVKVLLVDACRDDPTEGKGGVIELRAAPPPPSVAALFSCAPGEISWDDAQLGGGHGVFFHYVIEGLKGEADRDHNGKVTLFELTEYTQDQVPDRVAYRRGKRQMPTLLGNAGRITLLDRSRGAGHPEYLTTRVGGIKLKRIPGGTFLMGSPDDDKDAEDDEKPQHPVRLSPFYLGVTEVTQEQYEAVMGRNPSDFSAQGDGKRQVAGQDTRRHPVENVSWNDAIAFCNKLSELEGLRPYYRFGPGEQSGGDGYRLPTEAEWEYACRAGSTTKYSFGDDPASLGEYAWFGEDLSKGTTHPVGQKRPNAWGLDDMHGNVWEWCWDFYDGNYYKNSPTDDPQGPSRASARVFRGGGWFNYPRDARSAHRGRDAPVYRDFSLGFRVARVQSGP